MKIPLAALTLAVAGLSATPVNPPARSFEPASTGRVVIVPTVELQPHPHLIDPAPVPLSTLREKSASIFGLRMNRLDDRVSNLKARADLLPIRAELEVDFERLKALRTNVATALLNLRDPTYGLDAAEHAALTALNELDIAIEVMASSLDQLDRVGPQPIS